MNKLIPFISSSINDTLLSLSHFYGELIIVAGFLLVIIADLFLSKRFTQLCFGITVFTLVLFGVHSAGLLNTDPVILFGGMLRLDHAAILFKLLFCFSALLFAFFIRYHAPLQNHLKGTGDLFAVLLATILGMNLMAMSVNLLMVYISVEMVSLGSYLMVSYISADKSQTEAAMKYALFGAVCSAIMLYGISLLYGFTGTLNFNDAVFMNAFDGVSGLSFAVAIILLFVGIAFKLSIVPLHFWVPDVYEGAPTPVTAFLSTAPKIAGFALLIRLMPIFQYDGGLNEVKNPDFNMILAVLAIVSMLVGNFTAVWQNNVKRMLAYSSIGHTGFMLMALFALQGSGFKALIFYMAIYILMNMAAFLIVDEIEEQSGKLLIDDYKGLGKANVLLMTAFVIVLVSLTGLPPTAGFTAKFLVFSSAIEAYRSTNSAIILIMIITAAVSTVVSLFYYFKIPLNAFLRGPQNQVVDFKKTPKAYLGLFLAILLLVLIVFPSLIADII